MKQYYINDSFFHLNKFIIMADNCESMEIIDEIIPEFNLSCNDPDILLIRNFNHLTAMNGKLRYIVTDYLIILILGISIKEMGELEALAELGQNITQ